MLNNVFNRYTEYVREDVLRRHLGRLLWGYREFVDDLYAVHLSTLLSTLPRIPPELVLANVKVVDTPLLSHGGTSDAWKGVQGDNLVVLKAMRYFERAQTEVSRQVVEASSVPSFVYTSNSDERCQTIILKAHSWKQFQHPNVLPFLGFSSAVEAPSLRLTPTRVSPWMVNGKMIDYLKTSPPTDRLSLVRVVFLRHASIKY